MPRKASLNNEVPDTEEIVVSQTNQKKEDDIDKLSRMLGAVMSYLSDDELEELDIEYLLDDTEGLRDWWDQYRESNKKQLEEEIKESLGELSLKELEEIREKIKEKQN
ncbi:hypothetical protein COJ96_21930 [Bacillus sp. AFS073361]|uniref:hypothetical protein n=1 Tax=Bacillus sp. AFS073361 TaxID=2033511 RepID=UPI000BF8C4AF|nr:hypothetical protein [Bacillus sp. AFS073361]PFP24702.1 hypothetical protein COJ96_21930 [Bacillus sp. AFS073361]